jgi:hypothetical protein
MTSPDREEFAHRIVTIHPRCPAFIREPIVKLVGVYAGVDVHRQGAAVIITLRKADGS